MACYQVEVDNTKDGKQWLLQIEKVMKEITTNTPASYKASDKEHTGNSDMMKMLVEQEAGNEKQSEGQT